MGHYRANRRDIEFMLFEVLRREQVFGSGIFADVDVDTARSMLVEVERLATTTIADAFESGDREPPVFDAQRREVTMPTKFRDAFNAYLEGGWADLDLPPEMGGVRTPATLRWAISEMVLGANPGI